MGAEHTMGDALSFFEQVTGCKFLDGMNDHAKPGVAEASQKVNMIITAQANYEGQLRCLVQANTTAELCRCAEEFFSDLRK